MDRPGKVANPALGQLNRENKHFPVPVRAYEVGLVIRVRSFRPTPACSFSILRLNLVLTQRIPPDSRGGVHLFILPYATGSVPTLLCHANAYRWRSLPRVRRHRTSSPQGSSSNGCCLCITRDQLIFTSGNTMDKKHDDITSTHAQEQKLSAGTYYNTQTSRRFQYVI